MGVNAAQTASPGLTMRYAQTGATDRTSGQD